MARIRDPFTSSPKFMSPLRLVLFVSFLMALLTASSWLFYLPILQIYWGAYARLKPMRSEITAADLTALHPETKSVEVVHTLPVKTEIPTAAAAVVAKQQDGSLHVAADQGTAENITTKYMLTREMALKAATAPDGSKGAVVVTWANFHYKDFVMNWIEHLQATGCKTYLVGAMDDQLLQELIKANVPAFSMSSGLTLGDFGWGSPTFNKMGREKINLIQTFVKWEVDVIISDVDTVWLQDPVAYMKKYPEADILCSSDHLSATVTDGGLENVGAVHSAANIGIMMFRPKAGPLVDEWVQVLDKDAKVWDQNAFNDLIKRGLRIDSQEQQIVGGYDGKLKYGVLPVSSFCSGHAYFVQRMPEMHNVKPYVVHATFQFSGTPGKRNRFRERLLWNDPPSYFEHPVGFISMGDTPSKELLDAAAAFNTDGALESVTPHFKLVNTQLTSTRALFAAATILKRALVLPDFWCGQDRWWAPHAGKIPGSSLKLPFQCPADHVLDLEAMSKDWPEAEYGPRIEWREFSFLNNSRAAALRESTLTVRVCADGKTPPAGTVCSDGSSPAAVVGKEVWVQPKLNEKQMQMALESEEIKKFKVLHFENAAATWGDWVDTAAADKFKRRTNSYSSIFCCVGGHPGHVWYDFSWDKGPHKDRHNRDMPAEWTPILGP